MKRNITIFSRKNYVTTDPGGGIQKHFCTENFFDIMGQAKTIRYHFIGHWRSATARATLRTFESADPDNRPGETGTQIGAATAVVVTGATFADVTGPFCGRVELTLEIDDTVPAGPQEFECEVHATLILDE